MDFGKNDLTERDFQRAHTRAFVRKVLALLLGRSRRLLSFSEVKEKISWDTETYIGMRTVPVTSIIGSVGRYHDFDREFLPVQSASKRRWTSIDDAYYSDVVLPPVHLYKVGEVYFVKDGNHRVSVARERGVEYIDAEVIECRAKVALDPDMTAEDLEAIGEYAGFLNWSKLDQLRPDQNVRFTIPGGYTQLREHISVHRYYLGIERRRPITRDEAVASWYDRVYMPVVDLILADKILDKFPKRTEADLYLWIMDHLYFLRQRAANVKAGEAASDFVGQYAKRSLFEAIRRQITARGRDDKNVHEPPSQ
jgi:hypothetical protein